VVARRQTLVPTLQLSATWIAAKRRRGTTRDRWWNALIATSAREGLVTKNPTLRTPPEVTEVLTYVRPTSERSAASLEAHVDIIASLAKCLAAHNVTAMVAASLSRLAHLLTTDDRLRAHNLPNLLAAPTLPLH